MCILKNLLCCCCCPRREKRKDENDDVEVYTFQKKLSQTSLSSDTEKFPKKYTIYEVLHEHEPESSDELGFSKQDKLQIALEDVTDTWSLARNLTTKKTGIVPMTLLSREIQTELWFFPKVSRFMAETLLLREGNEVGTFLVRLVQLKENIYALSVRCEDNGGNALVKHYKIQYKDGLYYISNNISALSVQKLIQMYLVVDSEKELNLCTKLTNPCPRDDGDDDDFSTEELELERSDLQLENTPFNSGNFGKVYKAKWKGKNVVVKTLKSTTIEKEEFLKEVIPLKKLTHRNIVVLYGVCARENPFYMVLEYMEHGNLQDYMQEIKLALSQKIFVIQQIADGMAYLESKKCVHRDIAARNILLKKNLIAKLSDFGLSRFVSSQQSSITGGAYPMAIRWLAPESFFECQFSCKSDVWSFGLLMMEIFTEGKVPFYDCQFNKDYNLLFEQIKDGYVMKRPPTLPEDIYKIMLSCWNIEPKNRPSFLELSNLIETFKQMPETFES